LPFATSRCCKGGVIQPARPFIILGMMAAAAIMHRIIAAASGGSEAKPGG